jgi:capping protein beta
MSDDKQLSSALDLMRRLPPSQVEKNLLFACELVPDLTDELLVTVDVPLKIATDKEHERDYLLCDYNRDGDSYRSPWSNKYYPTLDDGILPSEKLRNLEIQANQVFAAFAQAYYEGGISSAYFWNLEDGSGFAACIVFKKDGTNQRELNAGVWDSIHIVEVRDTKKGFAKYKLSTTIILSLSTKQNNLDLSGNIQRQVEEECEVDDKSKSHICNMGNMIQKLENALRDQLESVYFDKAREITRTLRSLQKKTEVQQQFKLNNELANALNNRKR